MKTILITGINGFLGSNLAKALQKDYRIIGLEITLKDLYRIKDFNFKVYSIKGSIPEELFTEQKIDIIVHTATFYGRQNEKIEYITNANLFFPLKLLEKAITHDCGLFINTDTVLDRFVSPYALTKRQFQEWLYQRSREIKVVNMKLEHFYGPGASNANFITSMIERLKRNEPSIDLTPGEQLRDFVYIDDVVSAFKLVLGKAHDLLEQFTEFQVTTQKPITIKQLLQILKEITKSTSILKFGAIPYRKNELMHSESDNSSLKALGWEPEYTIIEGLLKTI
ncbi:MAG: NAD(P)-dependent oxidoreductase [Bacteroidales bacterium]|nr:NAD(P)-dependent oxidoreductase [Bacteroidales bacterium]